MTIQVVARVLRLVGSPESGCNEVALSGLRFCS